MRNERSFGAAAKTILGTMALASVLAGCHSKPPESEMPQPAPGTKGPRLMGVAPAGGAGNTGARTNSAAQKSPD